MNVIPKTTALNGPKTDFFQRFSREEDGVVTIFTVYLLLMILMVAGIGVDLMQNEMRRTSLQNTVDRAVLAAADLDQTRPPKEVVEDYFDKAGLSEFLTHVEPDLELNYRNVTATAFMNTPTQFMRLLGVDSLPVPAASGAYEEVPNVEISLVLDVSGSMRWSNRIDNLRPAAKNFVDIVLTGAAVNTTSINLIPYAGQTNPGPWMFDRIGGNRYGTTALDQADGGVLEEFNHVQLPPSTAAGTGTESSGRYVFPNVSSCIDFPNNDFYSSSLPTSGTYPQTPHFRRHNHTDPHVLDWEWCPTDYNSIRYASNNADDLKAVIENMRLFDGTGTHYAMRWALSLLNPSSQSTYQAMAHESVGLVPDQFSNRPLAYNSADTIKYIVLMTDGGITPQYRPYNDLDPRNPTVELWNRGNERNNVTSYQSTNVNNFYRQCNLAKHPSRNVVIYTIAFEAPGSPETQMRNCASSASHFFRATGKDEIDAAFSTIARQINELRLTQ